MEESIVEKNIQSLGWYDDENIKKIIDDINNSNDINYAYVDISAKGEKICAYEKENLVYLNSRYDAAYAADIWASGIKDIKYRSIIILVGLSNGMYVRSLLKILGDENDIILYEPSATLFVKTIESIDLSDIFADERVHVCVNGINEKFAQLYMKALFAYERLKHTQLFFLPNYVRLFNKEIEDFVTLCEKEVNEVEIESATLYHVSDEMNDNVIRNLKYIPNSSSINILKDEFEKINNYKDAPAIIIGAGPSLDKNIKELKRAKNKAFLIATDSAILALLKNDIIPDVLITIDPHKPMELFEDDVTKELPYVVCMHSRYEVMEMHMGKKIFFASEMISYDIYKQYNKKFETLYTGGSVACNAFSLAKFLGFKNIVFVGQDLAFSENRKHVKNIYNEPKIGEGNTVYDYVKDINGNDILTYANFKVYKEWFEIEFQKTKNIRIINATEGGAYIKGAEHIALKQVIDELCVETYDFEGCVKNVPDAFDAGPKEEISLYIKNLPEVGIEIENKLKETLSMYKTMKELADCRNIDGKRLENVQKKITQNIEYFDAISYMEMVRMYSKIEEFDVLENVYDSSDGNRESNNDILLIAEQGVKLIETYIKANKKLIDKLQMLDINV